MTEFCKFCEQFFSTKKTLETHQSSKYCKDYRYIIFTCQLCNFTTKNYKEAVKHNTNCSAILTNTNTITEKDENKMLKQKITNLEIEIQKLEEKVKDIEKLKNQLSIEQFKTKFFHHIISENTNIKINN